jgi:hypothetical protein
MQTYVYFHICRINNWKEIVETLWSDLRASGLYDKVNEIRAVVVGPNRDTPPAFFSDPKFRLLLESADPSNFERTTLNLLYSHSLENSENFHVLYIHSKGVTHNSTNPAVTDWTNYLTHFNMYKYEDCIRELENYDVVGVNLSLRPKVHFSGNFWWSTASHIQTLGICNDPTYNGPEFWITKKENGLYKSLWESGVNHYNERYMPSQYHVDT